MLRQITIAVLGCALGTMAWGTAARADGLLHRLPEDGATVLYDLSILLGPAGLQQELKGSLRMSSVGVEMVGDEKCRWIEFRLDIKPDGQDRTILIKALIPEQHLGRGKSPLEHVKRAWLQEPEQEVQALGDLKSAAAGPLRMFLAGPARTVRKLDAQTVENAKLGKIEADGEVADHEYDQDDQRVQVSFEHRFSDKAPFGLVGTRLTFRNERNGVAFLEGSATFTLTDVGTTALTELPNNR